MRNGIVKWFNKGFGFIVDTENGQEAFVHWSDIVYDGFKKLFEGDEVSFEIREIEKGLNAVNVKLLKRVVDTRKIKPAKKQEN
jgi:CspA family cold shock protein